MKIGRNDRCPCGSGRKYKRCHLGREPLKEVPTLLPDTPAITFEEIRSGFRNLAERALTEPAAFATGVLDYARREIPFESVASGTEPRFHVWGAGALALAALALPQSRQPIFPLRCPQPDYVRELLTRLGGFSANELPAKKDSVWLTIQRIISLQPSLQGDSQTRFFQSLFLLELVDGSAQRLSPSSPYDPLFDQYVGCTALEYVGMLFGFYAQSRIESVFNVETLFKGSEHAARLRALAERIFASEGSLQENVGDLLDTNFPNHQAEGLVQAFFAAYPFIKVNDTRYLPALHPFLRLLAASGPVFRTLELARKAAEARGQSRPWTNAHSEKMGRRFEELLRTLIETARLPGQWEAEYEYVKGQKSPDFILFEDAETVILIQAKLKRMTPGAFFGYDLDTFRADIERFAEMIWRSIRYLRTLQAGRRAGDPLADSVTERVLAGKRVVLIGIAPFLSPVFVPGLPRDAIIDAVKNNIRDDGRNPFDDIAGWHIMGFEELAMFFSLPPRAALGQAILDYVREMGDTFITPDGGMVPSFRNWCIHRSRPAKAEPPAAWPRALQLLSTYTKDLFRPAPVT